MISCQSVGALGWVSVDITSYVQQVLAGDKVMSLALVDFSIANRLIQFDSRETSSSPVLTVK